MVVPNDTIGVRREAILPVAEATTSAVSWASIFAGAVAAAALSLILLAAGTGLGLSAISPWAYQGASTTALGAAAIIWLLVMSLAASGLGGYIAGRLRTKWTDIDVDEAHFRDTAHGFLAWAVATVLTAAVLTSAASSMVGTAATAGTGAVAGGAAATAGSTSSTAGLTDSSLNYYADMLLRGAKTTDAGADTNGVRREVGGILRTGLADDLSAGDRAYLAQLVSTRTGSTQTEAEQRVTQVVTAAKLAADAGKAKAKEVAEATRKATVHATLWIFVSLLVGAFYAALSATWGGKQRDAGHFRRQPI